jgi:Mg-chelatase subunit ChlD
MATKAIGILVDCSGSMGPNLVAIRKAILAAYTQADAADVPMTVWSFSDWAKSPALPVVPFGLAPAQRPAALAKLQPAGGTVLASPLAIARRALAATAATTRILLVLTDFEPLDRTAAFVAIRAAEPGTEIIGILVGLNAGDANMIPPMRELFNGRLRVAGKTTSLAAILRSYI